jgi:hypothetical protein
MPFREDVVGITTLLGVHGVEAEVIDEEQVDREELPQLRLVALGKASMLERLEHPVGADGHHRVPTSAGDVAQGARNVSPTPTRPTMATW